LANFAKEGLSFPSIAIFFDASHAGHGLPSLDRHQENFPNL